MSGGRVGLAAGTVQSMGRRGRSRSRGRRVRSARPVSRSRPEVVERTARSLSVPGRRPCSRDAAAHILDCHGSASAAREEQAVNRERKGRLPSFFRSHSDLAKAVTRTLDRPDATQAAGKRRQFSYKTFQRPLGNSGKGHGSDSDDDDLDVDTVAVLTDKRTGIVTAFPIHASKVGDVGGNGSLTQLRPDDQPPSLLSDETDSDKPTNSPNTNSDKPANASSDAVTL